MIDLQYNYPILPGQDEIFTETLRKVSQDGEVLKLPPYGGVVAQREAAAKWLSTPEHAIGPERTLLAAGGHNAVIAAMIATGLIGKKIACDPLTYSGFVVQARLLECPLVACEIDDDGMLPESLDRAAREDGIAAAYLMPTNHNPLGIVMPLERRQAIVKVARKHGLLLIDDDAYRFTVADAPPHFAALAPELGIFVYSFTKPFAPAMKVAYAACPDEFVEKMTQAVRVTSSGAPRVLSTIMKELIENGKLAAIIQAKREEGAARQKFAQELLRGLNPKGYKNSYHVWIELPEELPSDRLTKLLATQGVAVSPSTSCVANSRVKLNGIRVALGAERDLEVIRGALEKVKKEIEAGLRVLAS